MDDLDKRFNHHAPCRVKLAMHKKIRAEVKSLAEFLCSHLPPGRERAVVLTKLEEVLFWSNAAIARDDVAFWRPEVVSSLDAE